MKRSLEKEMMDLPGNPPDLLEEDLINLRRINRTLGAYRGLLRSLGQMVEGGKTKGFSLLDVGTGCGDIPVAVVRWAKRKAITVRVVGLDPPLHGTSTVLNDKTETQAIRVCFGRRAYEIPMSSIKSMVGHPQGASGAAGVVSAILGMNDAFLPPTINYTESDPECDLNYIPNQGVTRDVEISLCNCIGFGSKNSALVVARGR